MKKLIILGLAALLAANLFGCIKKEEPANTGSNNNPSSGGFVYNGGISEYTIEFEEIFGSIEPTQGWNMGETAVMTVSTDRDGHHIGVYVQLCNRWYLLTECHDAAREQQLTVSYPRDIKEVQVVIDHQKAFAVKPMGKVKATGEGDSSVSAETWLAARPLSWIMAACAPGSKHFDYDDFVGRLTVMPDGSVKVQAMATGATIPMWLHYTDGENDYVISPKAVSYEGQDMYTYDYAVPTMYLDDRNKWQHEWHRWFDNDFGIMNHTHTINVVDMSGANYAEGAEVTLPAGMFKGFPNMSSISISNVMSDATGNVSAKPIYGFYVSCQTHDITIIPENTRPYELVMALWPMGYPAQTIIIPDVGSEDTATEYHGWCWPSAGSRIDLTYPLFLDWVKNPEVPWYTYHPAGWCDRQSEKDKDGNLLYWGYYPR